MVGRVTALLMGVIALLAVASATEVGVDVGTGSTIRNPISGHEYVLFEEVSYSPRLRAARDAETAPALLERSATAAAKKANAKGGKRQHALNPEGWVKGELIGRGGFGAIYKGKRKDGSGGFVAIKQVKIASDSSAPAVRAEVEVQKTLARACPGLVVGVLDSWESASRGPRDLFLVMELMAGDLHDYTRRRGTALKLGGDLPSALTMTVPIVRAVQCMHQHEYVHRDLKGPNFLIDSAGNIKVADFGETRTKLQIAKTGDGLMPHQTIVYNAPTAIRVRRDEDGQPHHEFIPGSRRTWDAFRSWDGYATGMTLLELYFGKTIDAVAHSSTSPKIAHEDLLGLLEVFLTAFGTGDRAYDAFLSGLNRVWGYSALPAEVDVLLRGLLMEKPDHTIAGFNTNTGPFAKTWAKDSKGVWVGTPFATPSASSTSPSAPASATAPKS